MTNFTSLGLSQQTVSTLGSLGFETPTPIQEKAIPLLVAGRDLIGLAQTGTGKTAAFGLPLIERLAADGTRPDNRTTRTLILAPTRELVNQIATNLKSFLGRTPLRINVVVGGVSINRQQQQLEKGTDILVATPGRLLDLVSRRAIGLTTVRFLVLDEADQMLDLGFVHDLRKIAKLVPKKRQTMLFSATMPKTIAALADEYLTDPVKVEVTPPGRAADKVEQYVHFTAGKNDKTDLLKKFLTDNPDGRSIVFLRTKHGAEKLMKHLDHVGYSVASIHGNKSQGQRERALKAFRDGEIKTLIATDVAARGIDIPAVSHVFNYDLPEVPDAYVHRIGRTARAGRDGVAIAFCAPDETRLLRDIEKLMGISIAVAGGTAPADMNASPKRANGGNRGQRSGEGRGGQRQGEARGGQRRHGEGRPAQHNGARRSEVAEREPAFDNDLAGTSDVMRAKPARTGNGPRPQGKPQRPAAGEAQGHHRGGPRRDGRPQRGPGGEDRARQGEARGERTGEARRGNAKTRGPRRERA